MSQERLTIFVTDIPLITGQSQRSAERLVRKIRERYNLPRRSLIRLDQFCEFMGFDKDEVKDALRR